MKKKNARQLGLMIAVEGVKIGLLLAIAAGIARLGG